MACIDDILGDWFLYANNLAGGLYMTEFKCPKCKTSFSVQLAHVSDGKGKEVTGQPVITCKCGSYVIPYLGEQTNSEIITKLEEFLC
jgi:DNA-directed RNA polymerase subunit RPC12/RpoP